MSAIRRVSERQGDLFSWTPVSRPESDPAVGLGFDRNAPTAVTDLDAGNAARLTPRKILSYSPDQNIAGIRLEAETPQCDPAVLETSPEARGLRGATAGSQRPETEESRPAQFTPQSGAPILRPYQSGAIAAIRAQFDAGVLATLLVLATGAGKTVCFAELARQVVEAGKRVLVVAHREELLEQAKNKLTDVGVVAAIEQANRRAGSAPVIVASVATLRGERLERLDPSEFGLVVVDEGHHAFASSYRGILDHFASVPKLGVTATPDRGDGHALGEVYESVAYRYELRAAIRDGWLAPIRARRIVVEPMDLSSVKTRAGDLAQDQLAEIMAREEVLVGIVGPLLEQATTRKTIVFAVDVATSHALAALLNRYRPGCARAVDGTFDKLDRRQTLVEFSQGAFQFLVNCQVLTEGYDEPSVSCIATCRPTKSRALYTQMVGRGTRLFDGKADCLVLDFVGNSGKHKLVGPVDALAAGEISDEARDVAEWMLLDKDLELDDLLDTAEVEAKRRIEEAALAKRANYWTEDIDPFLGDCLGPRITEPWADDAATSKQLDAIMAEGLKNIPEDLTKGEAQRILDGLAARRRAGLSTPAQSRVLKNFGVDTRTLTKARAGQLMACLTRTNFNPRALQAEIARLATLDFQGGGARW